MRASEVTKERSNKPEKIKRSSTKAKLQLNAFFLSSYAASRSTVCLELWDYHYVTKGCCTAEGGRASWLVVPPIRREREIRSADKGVRR